MCGFKSYINVYTRAPLNSWHACLDNIFKLKNSKLINRVIQTTFIDH